MKNYGLKRHKSPMTHSFGRIPQANIQRSSFRRSHSLKTMFSENYLYPIYADEVLPGDTFKLNMSTLARITKPLHEPIIDNAYVDFFFFFCPNRILWDNWVNFMGEHDDNGAGGDAGPQDTDYVVPIQTAPGAGYAEDSLADYFGIPPLKPGVNPTALHFRAYNYIWNSWFRSTALQDSVKVDKGSGPDSASDYTLLKRNKRHDYFTSCMPWPQLAHDGAVTLPLGTTAPVITGADRTFSAAETPLRVWNNTTGAQPGASHYLGTDTNGDVGYNGSSYSHSNELSPANLHADLTNATAATINSLREAFALQKLLERDARGGNRYSEVIKSHFMTDLPDQQWRPEYLGGGTTPVTIQPIANASDINSQIGELKATAYAHGSGIGFSKSFNEHGVLIGLANLRADLTYSQGTRKMWFRSDKYDFYWPALSHIGEQAVKVKELFTQDQSQDTGATGTVDNERIFGYNEAWSDYRYFPSLITSRLRPEHTSSLDSWHLSQEFGTLPELNSDFIEQNAPFDRIISIPTEPTVTLDAWLELITTRPMPVYSTPGLIDHF